MVPVGNTIIPPNPNQGINTLSGILGIRQQQQNLQTGAYQQQTAQAESQQAQQKNQELAKVGALTQGAYTSGKYSKPDGTFDNAKFANDVSIVAPTYGQQIANDATLRAGEIYKNQQTYFNLEKSKQDVIGDTIGALAGKADVNPFDVSHALEGIRRRFPEDHDLSDMLQSVGGAIPPTAQGPQLQSLLNTMAASLKGTPAVASATNAANQIINRAPYSGQLSPSGTTPTAGPPVKAPPLNPTASQVAGATTRQTGTGNADVDASNNVVAAQREARTNIDLTKRIDQLADVVSPGAVPGQISTGLGALGLQSVSQARSELQKDLGRLRGNLAERSGSDERARTLLSGLPTDETPTQTIHQAMDITRGSARQDLALGNLREKNANATGGQMSGFQGEYSHAVAAASPLMHEYAALSPQEQVGFFQRNFKTKAQAQAFRAQAEAVKKMSPDVIGK
jgi:hypothetical protein